MEHIRTEVILIPRTIEELITEAERDLRWQRNHLKKLNDSAASDKEVQAQQRSVALHKGVLIGLRKAIKQINS
jgi:hypothetical protein